MSTKERPILFNGAMVRAILEGRKTQTRRVMRNAPVWLEYNNSWAYAASKCPFGKIGDRLWVRERWTADTSFDALPPRMLPPHGMPVYYHVTAQCMDYKWRPSIHMPRWASRIMLEVTDVRVQRLQEVSEDDALAEGIAPNWCGSIDEWDVKKHGWINYLDDEDGTECIHATSSFRSLWDSINAQRGHPWSANPWVWAISFKVVQPCQNS